VTDCRNTVLSDIQICNNMIYCSMASCLSYGGGAAIVGAMNARCDCELERVKLVGNKGSIGGGLFVSRMTTASLSETLSINCEGSSGGAAVIDGISDKLSINSSNFEVRTNPFDNNLTD